MNQPQAAAVNPPDPKAPVPNTMTVHQANLNQQQAQAGRISNLDAARQKNLLKIQQLQRALEAAQQMELQLKAAQEQHQQQMQMQQVQDRQNAINQLQGQLLYKQQFLDHAAGVEPQHDLQMQQGNLSSGQQLRNLLQQQIQRNRQEQGMMQQQYPNDAAAIYPRLAGIIGQVGQQQQSWDNSEILNLLPP